MNKWILLTFLALAMAAAATAYHYQTELQDQYYQWKYPITTEYMDAKWKILPDSTDAVYYREIRYDENLKPFGIVTDYHITGEKQWEGKVYQLKPFRGDGKCIRYYKDGQIKDVEYLENGGKHGVCYSYTQEGELSMERYFHQDTFILPGITDLAQFIEGKTLAELKTIRTALNQSYRQEKRENYKSAAIALQPIKEKYPAYTYAFEKSADFNVRAGLYAKALADYTALSNTAYPNKDQVETQIIACQYQLKAYEEAYQLAENLMNKKQTEQQEDQYYADAMGYKGLSAVRMNQVKMGQSFIKEAISRKANPAINFEWAQYHTDKQHYNTSNQILEQAIAAYPEFAPYYGLRSVNFYKVGDTYAANNQYDYYLSLTAGGVEFVVPFYEHELTREFKAIIEWRDAIHEAYPVIAPMVGDYLEEVVWDFIWGN